MKFLCLSFVFALSLAAFAEETKPLEVVPESPASTTSVESNQGSRGSVEARNARSEARQEFFTTLSGLREQLKAARQARREAMKAARSLSGDERDAAMAAAREAFHAKLEEIRTQRRAAREKFIASISNRDEARAMAEANAANEVLNENAQNNDDANAENLVAAGEESQAVLEKPAEEVVAVPVEGERSPASLKPAFYKERNGGSRVVAQ